MAKVYLDANDTFTLSNAATVYGKVGGSEKVIINSSSTNVIVDQQVERVDFAGNMSTFTFLGTGNQLKVYSGATLVATTTVQEGTTGTLLAFANGTVAAKVGVSGMTLGGTAVPATAGAVTPVTIDAGTTSGAGTGGGGSTTAQTLTLTSGVDLISGTSGNDTIIADNSNATKMLSIADQIDGGAGTDTLKVYLQSTDTATNEPAFTGIENVVITGGAVVAYTPNSGVTSVTADSPVVATQATYTLNGQDLTLKNHTLTASAAATKTTTIAAAATATATAQKLTVDTFTYTGTDKHAIDLSGTKVTTLNLVTEGAGSTKGSKFDLTNTGAKLDTINVSGAGDVTVTEALAAVKTINASAATGKVTFDVSGATMNVGFAFTGGSGNDKLTMAAGNLAATSGLTSGAQLDFGAGTDTLVIKDTTPVYATINAMKNLEQVEMGVTAGTFDMSQLTAGAVQFGTVAAGTVSNLSSTDTVTATGSMSTSLTVGGEVGNSNATINLGTSTSAGITIASLVTTGLTTIAMTSNGTNAAANVLTAQTNSDNSVFNVTGSNDLTMNLAAGSVTGSKINAAGFTGKLVATGSTKADILIGGSGADTLSGATGGTVNRADVMTGGAGADTFKFLVTGTNTQSTDSASLYTTSAGTTAITKITDFVAGTDKIALEIDNTVGTLVAGTSMVLANAQTIATAADLTAVYAGITQIAASTNGGALSGVVVTVSAGAAAGTYLYINDATAAVSNSADMLINITGVSGTLTASDFTFA